MSDRRPQNSPGADRSDQPSTPVRVRFAPSPTGTLHIGSARTALFNWLFARHHGGRFVLRVDDTDLVRSEQRHEEAILADLRWLGLDWDEGPDVGGAYGPYRQRERSQRYRRAADELLASGAAYYCFCSEERIEELRQASLASGAVPRYDRHCLALTAAEVDRRLAAGEKAVIRFRVPDGDVVVDDALRGPVTIAGEMIGDFIIVRSDGGVGYNFASVVDDYEMAITHVIRGDDHLTNTARQSLVFATLGARLPVFAHHSLVLGPDGGKLSKRHGATSVGEYRDLGYLPAAIVNYLALLSWSHGDDEILSPDELIAAFDLTGLSLSAPVFDQTKLDWVAHEHVMALADDEHERLFAAALPASVPAPAAAALAAAFKPALVRYGQAPELAAGVLDEPHVAAELQPLVDDAAAQLERFAALRAAGGEWLSIAEARALLGEYRAWGKSAGIAARALLMPLRIALTGSEHGPDLAFVLAVLRGGETRARLAAAHPSISTVVIDEETP